MKLADAVVQKLWNKVFSIKANYISKIVVLNWIFGHDNQRKVMIIEDVIMYWKIKNSIIFQTASIFMPSYFMLFHLKMSPWVCQKISHCWAWVGDLHGPVPDPGRGPEWVLKICLRTTALKIARIKYNP